MCHSGAVTPRSLFALTATVVTVAATAGTAVGFHHARVSFEQEHSRPLAVGDCVLVMVDAPADVTARPTACGDDPSYTVGALTDPAGDCPTAEYQHFPAADDDTARLCLVPNLVAAHCYRLGMPIGVMAPADCTEPRIGGPDDGVLVRVTQRLDVHDQDACPSSGGDHAWPYPSPARTYCTTTLY